MGLRRPFVSRQLDRDLDCTGAPPQENVHSGIIQLVCWRFFKSPLSFQGAITIFRYLLIGAAVAMGAVAIWSMHFIGNRAINMSDGRSLQLAYNPGFTAASFFLPIICVGVAFYVFGITENVSKLGTLAGGICTGSAVCGMHYLGQLGITNYTPVYNHKFVAGSVIIAIVASTLALGVFFYLRSRWTNSWWKRVICAMVLASTVSGMHWVATGGTHYRITMATIYYSNDLSKHTTVVVTLCLV